jgi:hypothetical protein
MSVGRHTFVIIAMGLLPPPAAHAQAVTSDLVHFTGGSSSLTVGPYRITGGEQWYVQLGMLMWTARELTPLPVPITVTSRGLQEVLFFEPAPLLDVTLPTVETLRSQLQLEGNQHELLDTDAASVPPAVTSLRRTVRELIRGFKLKGLADVVTVNACQQKIQRVALASPDGLTDLLSCLPPFPNGERSPGKIAEFLRSRGVLSPILRSRAASADVPHVIGYVVQLRTGDVAGATSEIHAAAAGARAEKILTINLSDEKGLLQQDATKLFVPPVFTLIGIVFGAVLGFVFFQRQQKIQYRYFARQQMYQQKLQFKTFAHQQDDQQRRAEAERFHQRKYEKYEELRDFFRDTYPAIIVNERVAASDVRNRLMVESIYNILPADSVNQLNAICESGQVRSEQIRQLDQVLRQAFREFMTSDP